MKRLSASTCGWVSILVGPGVTLAFTLLAHYLHLSKKVQPLSDTDRLLRIAILAETSASVGFAGLAVKRGANWTVFIALLLSLFNLLFGSLFLVATW